MPDTADTDTAPKTLPPEPLLLLDDHRGIYIPRDFANECASHWDGWSWDDIQVLKAGPDHDDYWEAWDSVCDSAYAYAKGVRYTLYQDGALFAVPDGFDFEANGWA